uniref:Coiled-coil domain containing 117 n=1 Tax=Gongylonema pulchrum TaxID=637853 RepID=A0A183DUT2_9BILA
LWVHKCSFFFFFFHFRYGEILLKRTISVNHVEEYKVPKYREDIDEETRRIWEEGCAPKPIAVTESLFSISEIYPVSGVVKLNKALKKQMRKEKKRLKKEAKKAKKEEKRLKRMIKKEEAILQEPVPESSWKDQKKMIDSGPITKEEIYGHNEHFNFGKSRKEIPPPPTHNPRPDFEKADWRDIEIWKAVREKEKQEKGEKETNWKEEEHYLPSRFRRE